ncbi:MAG: DUF2155 domain-containing protein, partial [Alphaproteobacteria bacterium]|nr:DUF2155 domain-containing protein [Alphaproteobacteria bacterium]
MKILRSFVIGASLGSCSFSAMGAVQQEAATAYIRGDTAAIRALDKVTGRVSTATLKVGQQARFGALTIRLAGCVYMPP